MATGTINGVIQHLRRAALLREADALTDGQLLEGFLARREEAAFEVLVRRHGPMVLGVCRRVLHDAHEADDAFQATFLVLVRKAASIVPRQLVGNWLYGVAYRTALKAKAVAARRRATERQVRTMPQPEAFSDESGPDWQPLLDEELHGLPDKYRVPVVLCDLQGKSRRDAARQLDVPEGTLSSRLARARALLARRLTRRGVALSAGSLAVVLSQNGATACLPAPLVLSTVKAATLFAAGQSVAAGVISAKVAALTEGVLQAMLLTKLKVATGILVAVCILGSGAGIFSLQALADKPAAGEQPAKVKPPANENKESKKDAAKPEKQPDLSGQISAVADGGQRFTLAIPPKIKGDPATTIEIKLTDKTKLSYFGVEANGEHPTVGYVAQVWFVDGSQDTASAVRLGRKDAKSEKSPDLAGQITAVSKDLKTITLEVHSKEKGGQPTKVEIKLTDKTKFSYFGVEEAGAIPTVGYSALVWLTDGSKDTAAGIQLGLKNGGKKDPNGAGKDKKPQGPSLQGTVKAVDAGKGTITISMTTLKDDKKQTEEKTFDLAKDAKVLLAEILTKNDPLPEGKLADLTAGTGVVLQLSEDKKAVVGIVARGPDLRGHVKAVDANKNTITVTVKSKEGGQVQVEDKTFAVVKDAKVLLNDGLSKDQKDQEGKLGDLTEGTPVQVQLSVDRTKALGIRVLGQSINGTLKGYDNGNRTITIVVKEDGNLVEKTFPVAKDARVLDLTEGAGVTLQLSVFDRKTVVVAQGKKGGDEENE